MNQARSPLGRAWRIASRLLVVRMMMGRRQAFVGARWTAWLVRCWPRRHRASLALRLLGMSPHYFFRRFNPEAAAADPQAFRTAELHRNRATRRQIFEKVIRPFVRPGSTGLDYGCGAGFLAAAAGETMHVYAVDIAEGVLACAETLNPHPDVRYLSVDRGFDRIPDGGVDAAWLIAVTQHLTADEFDRVLERCAAKVRPGGRLLVHAAIDRQGWSTEEEWRADRTASGRITFELALNCFRRSEDFFLRGLSAHGFAVEQVVPMADLCGGEPFDDICNDHLIVARRA